MENFYSNNMEDKDKFTQIKIGRTTNNVDEFTLFRDIQNPTVKNQVDRLIPKFSEQVETRSQVYFLRNLIRTTDINYNNQIFPTFGLDRRGNIVNNIATLDFYNNATFTSNKNSKTLKQWFENTYDFNKIYSEEPPIKTFLQAYFGNEEGDVSKKIIDNFYLFFVVSNMNEDKCGNQIKLINDSKLFIDVLSNF
jgi:hypothetical protein